MAQDYSYIQDLLDWGDLHQSTLHPNVEIYQDPATGLSFRAKNAQPPGSTVVTSSYRIALSYLNAIDAQGSLRRSEPFPDQFLTALSEDDPNIIGHFFLMQQYLMGDSSFWWTYIRLLPQPDQPQNLGIPIWWPAEDRKFLDGTNAEPPLRKRKDLWRAEWGKGIALLQDHFENWQDYNYILYQWAATIFGSRSFRASLTVQESIIQDPLTIEHVKKDRFSVLLPILDIGNHNGFNNVDWVAHQEGLSLKIRDSVPAGDQIYNYYGNKSNSELLVAYGFTLPVNEVSNPDRDVVNLKLKPNLEALSLRRSQRCHVFPRVAEEEYTFMVQREPFRQGGIVDLSVFSKGLIDLIICMVANSREKRYITANPEYCPENDASLMEGFLARSALQTLSVLYAKLSMEQKRIELTGIGLSQPNNYNQKIALDYRHRQLAVISSVSLKIKKWLDAALTFCSFCLHTNHTFSRNSDDELDNMHQHVELLSLECAFEWLRLNYPEAFTVIVDMIAKDQEESLPLKWTVLVEDWDHTYWIVWIFTVWLLWARDGEVFRLQHKTLCTWLSQMNDIFDSKLASDESTDTLYADTSEIETINFMTEGIARMPQIVNPDARDWLAKPSSINMLRNFASFVAQEDTFIAAYYMQEGPQQPVEQRVLCIRKSTSIEELKVGGTWTSFVREAVQPRNHSLV